jgi:hypothetical protein
VCSNLIRRETKQLHVDVSEDVRVAVASKRRQLSLLHVDTLGDVKPLELRGVHIQNRQPRTLVHRHSCQRRCVQSDLFAVVCGLQSCVA